MVHVEGGSFSMGDSGGNTCECVHPETVSAYSIGQFEVTVEAYLRFADDTKSHYPEWLAEGNFNNIKTGSGSHYKDAGYARAAKKLPIVGITWDDANAYCQWLSQKTGKKYRLPLEKEWEFAAKGGLLGAKSGNKYAGSNKPENVAWLAGNAKGKPHIIGKKAPNELGLYDMSGNVWEFCQDKWAAYPGCFAPECANCIVLRGGAWTFLEASCRTASRLMSATDNKGGDMGFRCVRED